MVYEPSGQKLLKSSAKLPSILFFTCVSKTPKFCALQEAVWPSENLFIFPSQLQAEGLGV